VFVLNGGWLATTFDVYLLEDRRIDRELIVESGPRGHSYDDEQMASHVRGIEASTGFLRCVEFFEALQQALGRAARLALTINQVSASRQIPEREQLTYLLNRFGQPIEDPDHYGSLEKYGITTTGENIYVPLV